MTASRNILGSGQLGYNEQALVSFLKGKGHVDRDDIVNHIWPVTNSHAPDDPVQALRSIVHRLKRRGFKLTYSTGYELVLNGE